MWLFTIYGAYSAVCARKGDGGKMNPPDPHKMMIRARARDHLVRLRDRFPSLKRYKIITSPHNDYRFRIIIPKWRWQRVMQGLIREQDYDNFKNAVDHVFGTKTVEERQYHDGFLIPVWSAGYRFQTANCGLGIYDVPVVKKRKPGANAQTSLLPVSSKRIPVDVEASPFKGEAGGEVWNLGVEPLEHEQVLVVLDQDTGQEVVVIWSPGFYNDDPRAYADAIQARVCGVVAHPEYQRMRWSDAREGDVPVFDSVSRTGVDAVSRKKEVTMPEEKPKPNKVPTPIVEDTQKVGGIDKTTGLPVIRPKTPEGKADKLTEATDPRERPENAQE